MVPDPWDRDVTYAPAAKEVADPRLLLTGARRRPGMCELKTTMYGLSGLMGPSRSLLRLPIDHDQGTLSIMVSPTSSPHT